MTQMRSEVQGQLALFPDLIENGSHFGQVDGLNENESRRVGGRRRPSRTRPRGGGYQSICTGSEVAFKAPAVDPRLAELREVGLPATWLRIAQTIGFDHFMRVWQLLMSEGHVDDRDRIVIPTMGRYLRFQRNRLIADLTAQGMTAEAIQRRIQTSGEELTLSYIRRTMSQARMGAHAA